MFVYVYSVFVLSCVGSSFARGLSPVQGVLSTIYNRVFQPLSTYGTPNKAPKLPKHTINFFITIVFKSSTAKILIVLFLKIMLIMDSDDFFFIPQFLLASFRPSPKLPPHTCGPFAINRSSIRLRN
jgi:hypothetical protein